MTNLLSRQWRSATAALRRRPIGAGWVAWTLPVYGVFALVVGFSGGLFAWTTPALWEIAVVPLLLVVYPSLIEEFVFRGLLLPAGLADTSRRRQIAAVTLNTAAFVVYHPINHWTLSLSETDMFVEPAFLLIVAALGAACGYVRLRTRSLWSPIAIQWLTVVVWNLFLGRPR